MKSLFSGKRDAKCETCIHCAFSQKADRLLCEKKGLVPRDGRCFRYRYDPFKYVPQKAPPLPTVTAADFSLDDPAEKRR